MQTRKMEVAPTAHYSYGGVEVDMMKQRLSILAVGETMSGIDGANGWVEIIYCNTVVLENR